MSEPTARSVLAVLLRPVYLPAVVSGVTVGMLVPVLPLYLRDRDLSLSAISAILAAAGLGSIVGGLPSGALLARWGERRVLATAMVVMAVTVAVLGLVTAALALLAFRLLFGMGLVGQRLALQSQVTRAVAPSVRGRAMSYIGGSMRTALFIGPLLGGLLLDWTNYERTFIACALIAMFGLAGPLGRPGRDQVAAPLAPGPGALRSLRLHGRRLLLVAVGPALVMTAREGRYVVLPLIADDLGLSPAAVGALIAVGTGADMVLFPLSGHLMDRYGRLFAIVPAFSLMASGLAMLAVADSAALVGVAGVVIGIGNGMSAGTLLTLGSDLAPADSPGPFLAGLATVQDSGKVFGPLVVGLVADAFGLGTAAAVLAAILVVAIAHLVVVVGETGGVGADASG